MRSINIIMHFNSAKYAESLARGLCYEYAGLNIFFVEEIDDIQKLLSKGILLTDKDVEPNSKTIFFSRDNKDGFSYCFSKTTSLKSVLGAIKVIAQKEYGVKQHTYDKNAKVLGFFSKKGGSGVTSLAITMARIIAAKTEEKVLYLNLSILDDYVFYTGIEDYSHFCKMEYLFMKEEMVPTNIDNYCKADMWGVYFFKPEVKKNSFFYYEKAENLVDYILDEKYFSYIIVDYGKRSEVMYDYLEGIYEVKNEKITYTSFGNNEKLLFDICLDKESFFFYDEFVEISIKGKYSNSIESMVKESGVMF